MDKLAKAKGQLYNAICNVIDTMDVDDILTDTERLNMATTLRAHNLELVDRYIKEHHGVVDGHQSLAETNQLDLFWNTVMQHWV